MPVSQQVVVACDHRDCDQVLPVNMSMTDAKLDDAVTAAIADRSWIKTMLKGATYYCSTHAAELRLFFPEGSI